MILLVIVLALVIMFAFDRLSSDKGWYEQGEDIYCYHTRDREEYFYDPYEYETAERRGTEYDLFFDADGKPFFVEKGSYR